MMTAEEHYPALARMAAKLRPDRDGRADYDQADVEAAEALVVLNEMFQGKR